jgi:phage FluMu protein Com
MQAQASIVNNRKLLLSRIEAEDLQERDLFCPVCGFRIQTLYSDASGHLRVKCPKCKGIHILNLAYFRRIKRVGSYAKFISLQYKK